MEAFREYVLQVSAVALLCAMIFRLLRGIGTVKLMIKLLCGIILAYSVVQPMKQLDFPDLESYVSGIQEDADQVVQSGIKAASNALEEGIIDGTEAYILEKAKALNLDLIVEVEVSDDEIPVPITVSLTGSAAPYARSVLEETISRELNIPKEKQTWISH